MKKTMNWKKLNDFKGAVAGQSYFVAQSDEDGHFWAVKGTFLRKGDKVVATTFERPMKNGDDMSPCYFFEVPVTGFYEKVVDRGYYGDKEAWEPHTEGYWAEMPFPYADDGETIF